MSVVVSGDYFRFRLTLPSLLFLSKDVVKATHSYFDSCQCGGGVRTDNPPYLSHILRSKIIALWDMSQYQNSPRISLETSVFYLNFRVRLLLSGFVLNKQTGHGRGRNLYEVNFLSTASGTVDQYTILTPSPQRHLALIYYTD